VDGQAGANGPTVM